MHKQTQRAIKLLEWMLDHNQEDQRVTIGCYDCKESHNLMAATAYTAWLNLSHREHRVWIKNPFYKPAREEKATIISKLDEVSDAD